jgi:glycosyltransferase involved in cell wall biosynthesis
LTLPDVRIPVLVVTRSLDSGGAERHLLQVLPRLDAARFAVELLTLHPGGSLAGAYAAAGLKVHQADPGNGRLPRLLVRLARHIRRHRPLVHTFLMAAPLALALGARAIVMSRRSRNFYLEKHPLAGRAERFLHPRMDALVGNSHAVASDLLAEGAPAERVHVIENGIDLAPFEATAMNSGTRAAARARLGIPEQACVLACVANLFAYKGHADLLAAIAALAPEIRDELHLLCIGRDQGERAVLEETARREGLQVQFLGERRDVPELLAAADIGVLVSHTEGFSNAVLEYMAAGLPCIVSDVGGNADAVSDGTCGIVVPPQDCTALVAALARLASDAQLREQWGANARMRVEREFSLARCVAAYEGLYRQVLGGMEHSGRLQES